MIARRLEGEKTARVALITAGQSPRPEIRADLVAALPDTSDIVEFGALDALHAKDIEALTPEKHDFGIATRLRSGRQVLVKRTAVHAGIQD